MKQLPYHPYRWGLGLLISGFLLGCSDEVQIFRPADSNDGLRLELQASIDQVNETRADESGFADGDRFGVFVVNYSDKQPGTLTLSDNQANNIAFSYNADANKWQAASDIYWRDAETPADIYGYYPFHNGLGDVDAYRFEVQHDQSISGSDGDMGNYEASDFLWAKKGAAKPGQKVELTFSHIMAGVKVILQKGSGFEGDSWEKLPKLVTVDNTLRTANINLSTGVATPSGNFDRNIVMNPEGNAYRAVVVPQSVAAGKSVIGITIDGVSYSFTRDGKGMDYASGKLHTFTIKIDRKSDEGNYALTLVNEDITPWETDQSSHDFEANSYLVVHVAEPGTLKASLEALKADAGTIRNLKIIGNLTNEDFQFIKEMDVLSALNIKETKLVQIEWAEFDEDGRRIGEAPPIDNALPIAAFIKNISLRRIILPETLEYISFNCFAGLTLSSTIIIPESVKEIGYGAFSYTAGSFSIVLPEKLERIYRQAFFYSTASIELKLPNTIKHIGEEAFSYCVNAYGYFSLPSNLEYLGSFAFNWCGNDLNGDIVIPVKIKTIPEYAFFSMGFSRPVSVSLHEGIIGINSGAFGNLKFSNPIVFPKNLSYIGSYTFSGCSFVGDLSLPDNISYLGESAFKNSNIRGTIVIPSSIEVITGSDYYTSGPFSWTKIERLEIGDNVEAINSYAFLACESLNFLKIGKNVSVIEEGAFAGCTSLQTIVCLATTPPEMNSSVFKDVDFSHCVVEVPESSVENYRHADGWKTFANISPHRELNISLSEFSCLNKGISRELIVRADSPWKVAECPSWIHVSPDHADYKEEISVSVDPLGQGSGDREGKIVFQLKDSGYTNYLTIHQYDYDKEEDKEIILQSASAANESSIPVFIVGEGYGAESIVDGSYMARVNETVEALFAIEPFKSYRNMFTVSTAIASSPDNSAQDILTSKETKFGFCFPSIDYDSSQKVKEYAKGVSSNLSDNNIDKALIIVLANYESFAGNTYIDFNKSDTGCGVAFIANSGESYPYNNRALVQRYAGGMAFGGLASEEIHHYETVKGCTCDGCNPLPKYYVMKSHGLYGNVTISGKIDDSPWRDFIFHKNYSSIVDMYEGAMDHLRGVWRSESQSVMSTYIPYYNTASRYAIYKQIMRKAGLAHSIDDFIANDKIEIPQ